MFFIFNYKIKFIKIDFVWFYHPGFYCKPEFKSPHSLVIISEIQKVIFEFTLLFTNEQKNN